MPSQEENETWDALLHGDYIAAFAAVDRLQGNIGQRDLSLLFQAYGLRRSWDIRTDIVDLIGLVDDQEACRFLTEVSRGRDHYLVRYYAMMNLIEKGCGEWRPDPKSRKLRSDYYASLNLYDDFVRGRIDLAKLHEIARARSTKNGDHWEWLTHIAEGGRRSKE